MFKFLKDIKDLHGYTRALNDDNYALRKRVAELENKRYRNAASTDEHEWTTQKSYDFNETKATLNALIEALGYEVVKPTLTPITLKKKDGNRS